MVCVEFSIDNEDSHIGLSHQIHCICVRVEVINKLPTDIPILTLYSIASPSKCGLTILQLCDQTSG